MSLHINMTDSSMSSAQVGMNLDRRYKYFEQLTRNSFDQIQYLERLVYKEN